MSALLDGDLSYEDHVHLASLLRDSKQARQFYLRNLTMESALNWEAYSPIRIDVTPQAADSVPNEEINGSLNRVVPFANPWMVARNWLVGTVAASLALGLWLSTAWKKGVETPKPASVAQNLQPLKAETLEKDGQTTAYVYFQLNEEEDAPEG